ncbi:glycosyltransferase family 4 protein [Pseudoalteromonas piscicida]|uniref:glycosyltransferase family 4 protein n=1 Tax=Pseudoalteromonas piscicida TaxID=43662 RepID=UPI0030956B34
MRIIVATGRYPSKGSPYSHMFVHTRNKQYVRQGHEVIVLVPSSTENSYQIDGVSVKEGNVNKLKAYLHEADRVMIHLLLHRFDRKLDGGVFYKTIIEHKIPTLFFIHGVETQTIWGSRRDDIQWRSPISIARWLYRDIFLINKMKSTIKCFLDNPLPIKFVTPSTWMLKEAERHIGLSLTAKTEVIPNGIDTSHFSFSDRWEERHNLATIRPLYYRGKYALDLLIDSTEYLDSEAKVSIYGKGPDAELIKNKAHEASAEITLNEVFLDSVDIPAVHRQHGIYLGVTRMDAQGVSMCEAMASGLPVVSFDTCAIPEFVKHGETGLLASSYDVKEYASLVNKLLNDRELFTKLAQAARIEMEKIDIEVTTKLETTISL